MKTKKTTSTGKMHSEDLHDADTASRTGSGLPFVARVVKAHPDIAACRIQVVDQVYALCGCITFISGVVPVLETGQQVLVMPTSSGMALLGIWQDADAKVLGRVSMESGALHIEAASRISLTAGDSHIELDASGKIRVDGRDIHTFAKGPVRLQGSIIELN